MLPSAWSYPSLWYSREVSVHSLSEAHLIQVWVVVPEHLLVLQVDAEVAPVLLQLCKT